MQYYDTRLNKFLGKEEAMEISASLDKVVLKSVGVYEVLLIDNQPSVYQEKQGREIIQQGDYIVYKNKLVDKPFDKLLADLKTLKKDELTIARDKTEKSGFFYNGGLFETDEVSYMRLLGASNTAEKAIMAGTPEAFSVTWTLADYSEMHMTAELMVGIIPAFAMHSNTLHERCKSLKNQVDACTSVECVQAIKWG